MPQFSIWCPFGLLRYSGEAPDAERIYDTVLANEGSGAAFSDDFGGIQQVRNYARAMVLGAAKSQLDRARNNERPETATEMLAELEHDYGVVPIDGETLPVRRAAVLTRKHIVEGAAQNVIEAQLSALLGTDFVSYTHLASSTPVPPVAGVADSLVFERPGAQIKTLRLLGSVALLGSPITVLYESLGGTEAPQAGDVFTVEPNPFGNIEAVTIVAATGATLTATFTKAHGAGTRAVHPFAGWVSDRRRSIITVTTSAAEDAVKRQQINDLMRRYARGVSTWDIVADDGGVLTLNTATLDLLDVNLLS